jgi:hypothetical protein
MITPHPNSVLAGGSTVDEARAHVGASIAEDVVRAALVAAQETAQQVARLAAGLEPRVIRHGL